MMTVPELDPLRRQLDVDDATPVKLALHFEQQLDTGAGFAYTGERGPVVAGRLSLGEQLQRLRAQALHLSEQVVRVGDRVRFGGLHHAFAEVTALVSRQRVFRNAKLSRYVAQRLPGEQRAVDLLALSVGANGAGARHGLIRSYAMYFPLARAAATCSSCWFMCSSRCW